MVNSSFEELSIQGLGVRLQRVFEVDAIMCSSAAKIHMVQNRQNEKGEKLRYPALLYALTSWDESEYASSTAALFANRMTGPKVGPANSTEIGAISLVPVKLGFSVTYLDDDEGRVIRFLSKWMLSAMKGLLNFTLRVDDSPISIQVHANKSLSVPEKQTASDTPGDYQFETTVDMLTHVSGPFESALSRTPSLKIVVTSTDVATGGKGNQQAVITEILPPAHLMPQSSDTYIDPSLKELYAIQTVTIPES